MSYALYGAALDSNNHEIYLGLTREFKRRFFKDTDAPNVLAPDQLTRVTDYVPQIVRFVEKIDGATEVRGLGCWLRRTRALIDSRIQGLNMSKSLKN